MPKLTATLTSVSELLGQIRSTFKSATRVDQAALGEQVSTLVKTVEGMAGTMKGFGDRLEQLEKKSDAPRRTDPDDLELAKADGASDGVSWPMDINNPCDRDSVRKAVSFFDER